MPRSTWNFIYFWFISFNLWDPNQNKLLSVIMVSVKSCNQALTASDKLSSTYTWQANQHCISPFSHFPIMLHVYSSIHVFVFFGWFQCLAQAGKPRCCHNVDLALIRAFNGQSARRGGPRAVKTHRAARAFLNTQHLGRYKHSSRHPPTPFFPL